MRADVRSGRALSFRNPVFSLIMIVALTALAVAPFAGAQSTGGRIRGTVSDPSGGAVAAAKVTLINEATNVDRSLDGPGCCAVRRRSEYRRPNPRHRERS